MPQSKAGRTLLALACLGLSLGAQEPLDIPELIEQLRDPALRCQAFQSLTSLGSTDPRAIAAALRVLDEQDEGARDHAIIYLEKIPAQITPLRQRLFPLLGHASRRGMLAALRSLERVGGGVEEDPARLAVIVARSREREERLRAAWALAERPCRTTGAAEILARAAGENDHNLRFLVGRALAALGPAGAPGVPVLIEQVKAASWIDRRSALRRKPPNAAEQWTRAVGARAIETLGLIGPRALPAVPHLEDTITMRGHRTATVLRALSRITGTHGCRLRLKKNPRLGIRKSRWLGPDGPIDRPQKPATREPDGSWTFRVDSAGDYASRWVEFFLSRDDAGRPVVHADVWWNTDVGPPFSGMETGIKGSVVLRGLDWDSVETIQGSFSITMDSKPAARGAFVIENPFRR